MEANTGVYSHSVHRLPTWAPRAVTVLGFALFAPVGFLYLVSGLVVPQPWLALLWAIWVALLAYAVAHRHRPGVVLATPLAAALLWVAVVRFGGAVLNWTA